jgi:hypothetical protein
MALYLRAAPLLFAALASVGGASARPLPTPPVSVADLSYLDENGLQIDDLQNGALADELSDADRGAVAEVGSSISPFAGDERMRRLGRYFDGEVFARALLIGGSATDDQYANAASDLESHLGAVGHPRLHASLAALAIGAVVVEPICLKTDGVIASDCRSAAATLPLPPDVVLNDREAHPLTLNDDAPEGAVIGAAVPGPATAILLLFAPVAVYLARKRRR